MLDVAVLNQSIRHYVSLVTGLDIDKAARKANQDAPAGSDPFATVLITPVTTVGHDEITYEDQSGPDIDVVESRSGTRSFMASINFFQTGAINNAMSMQGAAYETINLEFLASKGLGFIRSSDYRDLTEVDLARYEERGQVDLFFYVIDDNSNVVQSVQSQEIEFEFDEYTNIIEVTE